MERIPRWGDSAGETETRWADSAGETSTKWGDRNQVVRQRPGGGYLCRKKTETGRGPHTLGGSSSSTLPVVGFHLWHHVKPVLHGMHSFQKSRGSAIWDQPMSLPPFSWVCEEPLSPCSPGHEDWVAWLGHRMLQHTNTPYQPLPDPAGSRFMLSRWSAQPWGLGAWKAPMMMQPPQGAQVHPVRSTVHEDSRVSGA